MRRTHGIDKLSIPLSVYISLETYPASIPTKIRISAQHPKSVKRPSDPGTARQDLMCHENEVDDQWKCGHLSFWLLFLYRLPPKLIQRNVGVCSLHSGASCARHGNYITEVQPPSRRPVSDRLASSCGNSLVICAHTHDDAVTSYKEGRTSRTFSRV